MLYHNLSISITQSFTYQIWLHVVEEGSSEHIVAHGGAHALQRVAQGVLHGAAAKGLFGYLPDLLDAEAVGLHIVFARDTQTELADDFFRAATWKRG